jgi:hypothetical protein
MNPMIRIAALCFLAAFAGQAFAEESAALLAKPGKLLFEDDFARSDMKPKWKVGKGAWAIKDGVVSAEEIPADKHGAYAYIDPNVQYKDAVVEFSFKLDGAKNLHLNMRDSNFKGAHAGHVLRATILPTGVQLVDMITGGMKNENYVITSDPKASAEDKKAVYARIKDKTANYKFNLDLSAWHHARVEVVGDEMLMIIDGKPAGYIKSEGIDHATKNMIGFTVGGKSAEIKDVKAWDATAAVGWTGRRAEVVAGLTK